jgi:pyrimidine-nucleoside phosphorylase
MRSIVEIIAAKRDGLVLTESEIRFFIDAYASDRMPDYQMSSMAMAIFFKGLNPAETGFWTDAMLRSGEVLDFSELGPARVDKHSTGGVGDKISLPLAPAAAACGLIVPMVSGRGLGHTGGTIDKLESIPGYRADIDIDTFRTILGDVGCAIIGQTAQIAPADKKLYALRDVTATVSSLPLITSSIMSKKLAEGIEGLVLDVKVGRGAFMKNLDDARRLAESMVAIGEAMGKKVIAFLTRMEEPLGRMIGNSCEVRESIEILRGEGPADVRELVGCLGGAMVEIGLNTTFEEGRHRVLASLDDGRAYARWNAMIERLGGDVKRMEGPVGETQLRASRPGYVQAIDGLEVGLIGLDIGAGRKQRDDVIDPHAGIRIDAPRGAYVQAGDRLATVFHGRSAPASDAVLQRLHSTFTLGEEAPEPVNVVIERVG